MNLAEYVGKRLLVKNLASGVHSPICEVGVISVSPSSKYVKVQWMGGAFTWEPACAHKLEFVEELSDPSIPDPQWTATTPEFKAPRFAWK